MDKVIAQIWSLIGLFTLFQNFLPPQLLQLLNRWLVQFQDRFNTNYELEIPQFKGSDGVHPNKVYEEVEFYLASLDATKGARRLTVFRAEESCSVKFGPAPDEVLQESFKGATMSWSHHAQLLGTGDHIDRRWFSLKMVKSNERFLSAYFDHIAKCAAEIEKQNMGITIYTNNGEARYGDGWTGVPFKHPSTFDSLALDPTMKEKIIKDLDWFKKGKEFHNRVGRAWKRGYLLYGPPGTGKSSLVAAISNYMKYNVYELELTRVFDNSELRMLLLQISSGSIIVIEDIDCSLDLRDRLSQPPTPDEHYPESRVTLSGLLNFTDGLWSCCGEERIIIFTTNHKDKLDPALLRSGRMDMHILLSFCNFPAFKSLAFNYLQIEDHPLFSAVEERMRETGAQITPAEISEILISHLADPLKALNAVISALDDQIKSTSVTESKEHKGTEERRTMPKDGIGRGRKKGRQGKAKRHSKSRHTTDSLQWAESN